MKRTSLAVLIFSALGFTPSAPAAGTSYVVTESEATYSFEHLLKTGHGASKAVKGKIVCAKTDAECEFLFAVATATFDSGNANRDAHMKETVKEAAHPIATVRGQIADLVTAKAPYPTVTIDFAGKTAEYPLSDLSVRKKGKDVEILTGVVLKMSAHDIERPSLLGASIKDEVPVRIRLKLSAQ